MKSISFKFVLMQALISLAVILAPCSRADEIAPDELVKAVATDVIAIIRLDKEIQAGNTAKVAELVETRVVPHFNFARMTQLAAARTWRLASPEQQKALIQEFRTLLVRTYSSALSRYRDQVIEFRPLGAAAGGNTVTVKSVVRQSGATPLKIDYEMEKTAAGWMVYDIKISDVSLVTTYRETFAASVREGGVDGLIRALAEKNRLNEGRLQSQQMDGVRALGVLVRATAAARSN